MNNVVFRPSGQPRVTLPNSEEQQPAGLLQDPAIILIAALGISLVMLVTAIGWLLIQG
ncbi:MAG: hypothetical protein V2I38_10845 [Alcanivoracaceae bacterium]|jgi:hypothetical protein|nr:hypothetical protein [Alcanivoracaceae bacterium]